MYQSIPNQLCNMKLSLILNMPFWCTHSKLSGTLLCMTWVTIYKTIQIRSDLQRQISTFLTKHLPHFWSCRNDCRYPVEKVHIIQGITPNDAKHVLAEDNKLAFNPLWISVAFSGNLVTTDKSTQTWLRNVIRIFTVIVCWKTKGLCWHSDIKFGCFLTEVLLQVLLLSWLFTNNDRKIFFYSYLIFLFHD